MRFDHEIKYTLSESDNKNKRRLENAFSNTFAFGMLTWRFVKHNTNYH